MSPSSKNITHIDTLQALFRHHHSLQHTTLQNLDLTGLAINWLSLEIDATTTFLGCRLRVAEEVDLLHRGALVIRVPPDLPYHPFRSQLYTWQELMKEQPTIPGVSTDYRIYEHFVQSRFQVSVNEALWQRIHDYAIDSALRELLPLDQTGMSSTKSVGFMGGHGVGRDTAIFEQAAFTAKLLTEAGYFVITGGGPGIMEAANLGAYLAGRDNGDFRQAIQLLAKAPHYTHPAFADAALEVLALFPQGKDSLAIPTWFYGHEPSNLFASHIAKYFSNSIREDTLLAISLHGVIYAPGSAGTTQEIFMDAAQNHYGTFNYYSPMVFLGRQRYEVDTLLYPLLRQLSHGRPYHDLLFLTDEPRDVVSFLQSHPPVFKE